MYKITVVRMNGEQLNKQAKGAFQMEFQTLSDIASFWAKLIESRFKSLRFYDLSKELTKQELDICRNKVFSLIK